MIVIEARGLPKSMDLLRLRRRLKAELNTSEEVRVLLEHERSQWEDDGIVLVDVHYIDSRGLPFATTNIPRIFDEELTRNDENEGHSTVTDICVFINPHRNNQVLHQPHQAYPA